MAITTKFLEDLGISKEIATQIFTERGKEMAEHNAKQTELENELATAKKKLSATSLANLKHKKTTAFAVVLYLF